MKKINIQFVLGGLFLSFLLSGTQTAFAFSRTEQRKLLYEKITGKELPKKTEEMEVQAKKNKFQNQRSWLLKTEEEQKAQWRLSQQEMLKQEKSQEVLADETLPPKREYSVPMIPTEDLPSALPRGKKFQAMHKALQTIKKGKPETVKQKESFALEKFKDERQEKLEKRDSEITKNIRIRK